MNVVDEDYHYLKACGETNVSHLVASISSLRKRAAKEGYKISVCTTTDYVGRKTQTIALMNPKTHRIVGR